MCILEKQKEWKKKKQQQQQHMFECCGRNWIELEKFLLWATGWPTFNKTTTQTYPMKSGLAHDKPNSKDQGRRF